MLKQLLITQTMTEFGFDRKEAIKWVNIALHRIAAQMWVNMLMFELFYMTKGKIL